MWTPIDTEFYAPRHPVDIVAVGESQEALLLRASLESLGAVVHLSLPGTPSDFLKVLARAPEDPRTSLCRATVMRAGSCSESTRKA